MQWVAVAVMLDLVASVVAGKLVEYVRDELVGNMKDKGHYRTPGGHIEDDE